MTAPLLSNPAFGQADLSNCEREQIHLAGSIQPHGALLVVDEASGRVVQASANAACFLGLSGAVLGQALARLFPDLARKLEAAEPLPATLRCRLGPHDSAFDCHAHRPSGGGVIIECERTGPPIGVRETLEAGLRAILATSTLRGLGEAVVRLFKDITGYDRVMFYRFDEEGHGEVFAEQRESHLEPYLGNRYPASDIPRIARQLYQRNRVRVLVDVQSEPVPLEPRSCPLSGQDLDMSLCLLRSMSPIHVQYLKNMGVAGTLVASLVVGGKLWGLIACHHYRPRAMAFEARGICEILAEAVATRIAALESFLQAQAELAVRRLEQRMTEAISRKGDWRGALFDGSQTVLEPVDAAGAALLFEDQILATGEVPSTQHIREIGHWLDTQPRAPALATSSLSLDAPGFAPIRAAASGVLATPISSLPGEYLIWFRPERVRTVTWGGNPYKPVDIGNDPTQLSPRRSFAQWHQIVEATSNPWTPADLGAARLIGESITDIVLQFRSVRMLIVQEQLQAVRRQVMMSEQPVLIAGPDGRVLASNEAFVRLTARPEPLQRVEDLLAFMADPTNLRQRLQELLRQRRSWRGEVRLEIEGREPRTLLVRADAVFAALGRLLGFVLLFTDLTEQKIAEAARRRFQEQVIENHRPLPGRLTSEADLIYRNLLSSIVENAQLAALEIADGVDLPGIPTQLENLQDSVSTAARALERLIRFTAAGGTRH